MKICPACKKRYEDKMLVCPDDSQALDKDLTYLVGTVLDGQYQIEALLGQGGMGAVYRARHKLLGDQVAIKIIQPEASISAEFQKRFLREGQAARSFQHPNVITVHDLRMTEDGLIYLVMEYIEGSSLHGELKKQGRFSPAQALEILEPIASALTAAHATGVVHRDLKPDNIMIGKSAQGQRIVKLLDLGLAKLRNNEATMLTVQGQILGTPQYMSPEQWNGVEDIDGRTDLYSLACVFYELIAGRRPFDGKTLESLACQHALNMPTPLHEVVKGVPPEFSNAIARALEKDRTKRQETCAELIDELKTALKNGAMAVDPQLEMAATIKLDSKLSGSGVSSVPSANDAVTLNFTPPTSAPNHGENTATIKGSNSNANTDINQGRTTEADLHLKEQPRTTATVKVDSVATPPASRTGLIVGVIALFLVVGGLAGYKFLNGGQSPPEQPDKRPTPPTIVNTKEVFNYWLQIDAPVKGGAATRRGSDFKLIPKQEFKFHFAPKEFGYIYIVGTGQGNAPMTFLTTKPAAQTGVQSNTLKRGEEYEFPKGERNWLGMGNGEGKFTIIYSPLPLRAPAFFNEPAGKELSSEENLQLADFLKTAKPGKISLINQETSALAITVPEGNADGQAYFFELVVEPK